MRILRECQAAILLLRKENGVLADQVTEAEAGATLTRVFREGFSEEAALS